VRVMWKLVKRTPKSPPTPIRVSAPRFGCCLCLPIDGSDRARSSTKLFLYQSRHTVNAAAIPTATPRVANNATIIATIARRVSVIEVRRFVPTHAQQRGALRACLQLRRMAAQAR
jgi:hypothetical protein